MNFAKITFLSLSRILFLVILTANVYAGQAPKSTGPFTLKSGSYEVEIHPAFAYTIRKIVFEGAILGAPTGFYGTVIASQSGKYIGSGHTEGGIEKIESIRLQMDGKNFTPKSGRFYKADLFRITKISTFDKLRFQTTIELSQEGLVEQKNYEALDDQKIHNFNIYMFCWSVDTKEWIAKLSTGEFKEGTFKDNGGWHLQKDIKWTALYDPAVQKGMMMYYPKVISGKSRKSTFWDVAKRYHKYYLMLNTPPVIPKGTKSGSHSVIIKGFSARASAWKEKAKNTAGKLKGRDEEETETPVLLPKAVKKKKVYNTPKVRDISKEDWMINRRGIEALDDNFVLPPFSPVVASENGKANVWGREYHLGPFGLIEQVDIKDSPFFENPMDFEIEISGRKIDFKHEKLTLLRNPKGKAEYISRGTSKSIDIEVRTTIEYDGMVKVDFTIIPKSCIELTGFKYRIIYPQDKAKLLRYDGAKTSGLSGNVPKHSYSMSLPEGRGTLWKSPFKTLVWMGDLEKGFLWFCASEQHWSPQNRDTRPEGIKIQQRKDGVELVVSPVTQPYVFSKPVTYTFGMFATPVRPLPKGWRAWTQTYLQHAVAGSDIGKILYHPAGSWSVDLSFYHRIRDFDEYRQLVEEKRRDGQYLMPYLDPMLMGMGILKNPKTKISQKWQLPDMVFDKEGTTENSDFIKQPPELKYFDEWKKVPQAILAYGRGQRQFATAIESSWSDFYCYLIEQHAKAGVVGTANLDEWNPSFNMNPLHGAGYVDQNGVRRFDYDLFAKRDLIKRMCAIFLKETGVPPIIIAHGAATLGMPFMSFASAIITGENMNTGYFASKGCFDEYFKNYDELQACLKRGGENWYYYAAPIDRWQTECLGKQFGFPMTVMANLTKSRHIDKKKAAGKKATRDFMALVVIHDNLTWPTFCNREVVYETWDVREEFGIADDAVEFYPYWGSKRVADTEAKDIYISAYKNKKRWLVNISNLGLQDSEAEVKINRRVFGARRPVKKVINAVSREVISVKNNSFTISLDARDFIMLFVE